MPRVAVGRSGPSPQMGFKSLSARCSAGDDGSLLLSHFDIVKEAVEHADDETLTNQCNIMCDFLYNQHTRGSKVHKAKFDESCKFKRGMNLKNWFEQRFVDVSQNPGAAELRYFLSEKLYLHPELRLPPTKTVMDLAKARFSPEDTDEMMYRAYVDAGAHDQPQC